MSPGSIVGTWKASRQNPIRQQQQQQQHITTCIASLPPQEKPLLLSNLFPPLCLDVAPSLGKGRKKNKLRERDSLDYESCNNKEGEQRTSAVCLFSLSLSSVQRPSVSRLEYPSLPQNICPPSIPPIPLLTILCILNVVQWQKREKQLHNMDVHFRRGGRWGGEHRRRLRYSRHC